MRHVVLVGATDGIGLALARSYLKRSWRVALLGRDPAKLEECLARLRDAYPGCTLAGETLDAAGAEVTGALERAVRSLGQMDLLVYCAGVMEGEEGLEAMGAVNFLGAARVLRWGAAYFAAARTGRLAAIGSVAGDRGRRGNPAYGATKAALHAYLEGLRHELHPVGVGVSTIKPGWVRTRMLGEVPGFPPAVSADAAAERIVTLLERGRDVFYVPGWWRGISLALRLLPTSLFKRIAPP